MRPGKSFHQAPLIKTIYSHLGHLTKAEVCFFVHMGVCVYGRGRGGSRRDRNSTGREKKLGCENLVKTHQHVSAPEWIFNMATNVSRKMKDDLLACELYVNTHTD